MRPQGSPISSRPLRGAIPRTAPGPKLCPNVALINTTQHQQLNCIYIFSSGIAQTELGFPRLEEEEDEEEEFLAACTTCPVACTDVPWPCTDVPTAI